MKLKPDRPALRLRRIPINTFIHTPTEAEVKELLAILHENGLKWCSGNALTAYTGWESYKEETCYYLGLSGVEYACKVCRIKDGDTILTFSEFKERYVLNEDNFAKSEEKPQPKFKVGDRVWAKIYHDQPPFLGTVTFIRKNKDFEVDIDYFKNQINKQVWCCRVSDLEPYTKSETKPTEDMETKEKESGEKGNNSENPQLDLCELLKGIDLLNQYFFIEKIGKLPYQIGEVVAVAQSYKDAGYDFCMSQAAYINKMFTKAEYMPHQIRITNVRVERLQDISDEDCIAEGAIKGRVGSEDTHFMKAYYALNIPLEPHVLPQGAYAALINRISGKGTWESNPYVFVYDFELIK